MTIWVTYAVCARVQDRKTSNLFCARRFSPTFLSPPFNLSFNMQAMTIWAAYQGLAVMSAGSRDVIMVRANLLRRRVRGAWAETCPKM